MNDARQAMQGPLDMICIDDDVMSLKVFEIITKRLSVGGDTLTFSKSEEALAHISSEYSSVVANNALIFIDINMFPMSGWQVVEKIYQFSEVINSKLRIFITSISVSPEDVQNVADDTRIRELFIKPFTVDGLQAILSRYRM